MDEEIVYLVLLLSIGQEVAELLRFLQLRLGSLRISVGHYGVVRVADHAIVDTFYILLSQENGRLKELLISGILLLWRPVVDGRHRIVQGTFVRWLDQRLGRLENELVLRQLQWLGDIRLDLPKLTRRLPVVLDQLTFVFLELI